MCKATSIKTVQPITRGCLTNGESPSTDYYNYKYHVRNPFPGAVQCPEESQYYQGQKYRPILSKAVPYLREVYGSQLIGGCVCL